MSPQINLSYKSYLFIDMIALMIFINIKNYHKSYFYKNYSLMIFISLNKITLIKVVYVSVDRMIRQNHLY